MLRTLNDLKHKKTIKIKHKNRKDFVSSHTQKTCGPNLIYF